MVKKNLRVFSRFPLIETKGPSPKHEKPGHRVCNVMLILTEEPHFESRDKIFI